LDHINTTQAFFRPGSLHIRGRDIASFVGLDDFAFLCGHCDVLACNAERSMEDDENLY
jgi:hypothetical protein